MCKDKEKIRKSFHIVLKIITKEEKVKNEADTKMRRHIIYLKNIPLSSSGYFNVLKW